MNRGYGFSRFVLAFFSLITLTALADDDSPMFQGDAKHSGFSNTRTLGKLKAVRFSIETDGAIRSTPALYRGVIYFGSNDGHLYAADANTGTIRWKVALGGAVNCSPAVANGLVYAASRNGKLTAVSAETGRVSWTFEFAAELPYLNGFDYYSSSPTPEGKEVFVGAGDGFVYALDAVKGKLKWKYDCGVRVRASAAVTEDVVVIGTMDGRIVCLDRASGAMKWNFATMGAGLKFEDFGYDRSGVLSSPSIAGGIVTAGCRDGLIYAVHLADGSLRWKFDHEISWAVSTPGRHNGRVYSGTSDGRFFQAIDEKTGTEAWRLNTSGNVFSSPAMTAEQLFFGDLNGTIYAADILTGKEQWRFKTGGAIFASPLVRNGILYCGSDDGYLYALEGTTQVPSSATAFRKAVFWENAPGFKYFRNGVDESVRDFFSAEGYEVIDAKGLAAFMEKQIADKDRSVVVFADHRVPATVTGAMNEQALIRRYLDAGGKIVWLGTSPMAYQRDSTGNVMGMDFTVPERVLGIKYPHKLLGRGGFYHAQVTPEGVRWGLHGWWVGFGGVEPKYVTAVLALNEDGLANAWIKNYGGPEGTGLLQLWIARDHGIDLTPVKAAAEYGLY